MFATMDYMCLCKHSHSFRLWKNCFSPLPFILSLNILCNTPSFTKKKLISLLMYVLLVHFCSYKTVYETSYPFPVISSPEGRPGISDACCLSGISGLSFDSTLLFPLKFFYWVLLHFLSCPFYANVQSPDYTMTAISKFSPQTQSLIRTLINQSNA